MKILDPNYVQLSDSIFVHLRTQKRITLAEALELGVVQAATPVNLPEQITRALTETVPADLTQISSMVLGVVIGKEAHLALIGLPSEVRGVLLAMADKIDEVDPPTNEETKH
jgi:hypothetical protein